MEGKKTGKLSVKSYNYCLSYNFLRGFQPSISGM